MPTTKTETGFTPDFEAYVVAKSAELMRGGMEPTAAVKAAMGWTLDLYRELATGQTARARAFRVATAARVWQSVRKQEAR